VARHGRLDAVDDFREERVGDGLDDEADREVGARA
jgi:hypothetical protein